MVTGVARPSARERCQVPLHPDAAFSHPLPGGPTSGSECTRLCLTLIALGCPQAVFFQGRGDAEVYPRPDGSVYVTGFPDPMAPVCEAPGEVEVRREVTRRLASTMGEVSTELAQVEPSPDLPNPPEPSLTLSPPGAGPGARRARVGLPPPLRARRAADARRGAGHARRLCRDRRRLLGHLLMGPAIGLGAARSSCWMARPLPPPLQPGEVHVRRRSRVCLELQLFFFILCHILRFVIFSFESRAQSH